MRAMMRIPIAVLVLATGMSSVTVAVPIDDLALFGHRRNNLGLPLHRRR
jgi:hypothetical protein